MAAPSQYTLHSSRDRFNRPDFYRRLNSNFTELFTPRYDDLREPLTGKNLYGVPGQIDFDFDNGWIVAQESGDIDTAGDVVFSNYQLPHSIQEGSTLSYHLHWYQTTETSRTITGRYRILQNGLALPIAWTDFTATCTYAEDNIYPWAAGGLMQKTELVDIDLTGVGLSAIIQIRIARTDANALNDMYLLYMDPHYIKDSLGSITESTK